MKYVSLGCYSLVAFLWSGYCYSNTADDCTNYHFEEAPSYPEGGNIQSLLSIHEQGMSRILAGSEAGLYFSDDGGHHWNPAKTTVPDEYYIGGIGSIVEAPSTVAIPGSCSLFAVNQEGGTYQLYCSKDGGQSWTQVDDKSGFLWGFMNTQGKQPPGTPELQSLAGQLFIFNKTGIITFTGNRWELVSDFTLYDRKSLKVMTSCQSALFAGTDNNIYRSDDRGKSWSGIGLKGMFQTELTGLGCIQSEQLIATTRGGLFLWADGIWKAAEAPEGNIELRLLGVADDKVYVVNNDQVISVYDAGGSRLNPLPPFGNLPGIQPSIILATDSGELMAGTDWGVLTLGHTGWTARNTGITSLQLTGIVLLSKNELLTASARNGFFYSPDSGQSWMPLNKGLDSLQISTLAKNDIAPGVHALDNSANGYYWSGVPGEPWQKRAQAPLDINHTAGWVGHTSYNGSFYIASTQQGVVVTHNNGQSYEFDHQQLPDGGALNLQRSGPELFTVIKPSGNDNKPTGIYHKARSTAPWSLHCSIDARFGASSGLPFFVFRAVNTTTTLYAGYETGDIGNLYYYTGNNCTKDNFLMAPTNTGLARITYSPVSRCFFANDPDDSYYSYWSTLYRPEDGGARGWRGQHLDNALGALKTYDVSRDNSLIVALAHPFFNTPTIIYRIIERQDE